MTLYKGRAPTATVDNCFIHSVGNAPTRLVGIIAKQGTSGRGDAPAPQSGFDTAGTPFACGHVMALELGGSDVSENIVPQYGEWQGRGAWRRMEQDLLNSAVEVMVVEISYDAVANDYDDQKRRFSNGEKLLHWIDPRIPTRFRVWAVMRSFGAGTPGSIADYLAADDAGKEIRIGPLVAALGAPLFDQAINAMPDEDREYWRMQMVLDVAENAYPLYYTQANKLRDDAIAAALPSLAAAGSAVGTKGGPMRVSRRNVVSRLAAHPYASPLPPEPMLRPTWMVSTIGKNTVANAIKSNSNDASIGWSAVERTAFTAGDVATAVSRSGGH